MKFDEGEKVVLGDTFENVVRSKVVTPRELMQEIPLNRGVAERMQRSREAVRGVLRGTDDRLLVVVGPCSIHDVDAAKEYAESLRGLAEEHSDDLLVVMRMYVEKPRTVIGWPGFLVDPGLDGTGDAVSGLRAVRELMLEVVQQGVPVATEWLSPAAPAYLADLVTWAAIGARTVESQTHRQLVSGLPMPTGMKNTSTGSVEVAVNAVRAAAAPHTYFGVGDDGCLAVLRSGGNPDCNVVLRGAPGKPNYGPEDVREAEGRLTAAGLPGGLIVDASHDNSGKNHERQAVVAQEIADQISSGAGGIRGVMLESFLVEGRQNYHPAGQHTFGQSITDACLGWDSTVEVVRSLALAVRSRRIAARKQLVHS